MAGGGVVVELRVHGVSGTPAEALLTCPTEFLERVAGDKSAGFYRRQAWIDSVAAEPVGGWRSVLEAYSWGGLTSGKASRAVWLLFLPFIFVNLAHWMLPPATDRRSSAAVAVTLLRLIALSLTQTLMLAAAVAVLDVAVWQCAALDYCAAGFAPLSAVGSLPRGAQVAVGAVPLVAVIALLWRLGRENSRETGQPPSPAVLADEVPLESRAYWAGDPSVLRLRACHVMAWTAGLTALVLAAPARYATGGTHAVAVGLIAVSGLLLAVAVIATAWNRATARGGASADAVTRPLLWLRWVSLAVLAVSLVFVAVAGVTYPPAPTHYPGLRGAIYVLLAVQAVLLFVLFVFTALCVRGRRTTDADAPSLRGFTAPVVALLSWFLGGVFSVGVGLWTAQVLGRAVLATADARDVVDVRADTIADASAGFGERMAAVDADAPLIVPPPYFWSAMALMTVIAAAAVVALGLWWWIVRRRTPAELRAVLEDYPGAADDDPRARQVASARALAALPDVAIPLVAGLTLFAVAEIGLLLVWYLSDRGGFAALPEYLPAVTDISVFITGALAIGLVGLAVQAYRSRQLRRVVAVLWDIMTFWPRANHPLTPPCYAERTVPELADRIRALVAQDARVIVTAHSQGTVIAAATLLQTDPDVADRVALLTFGSPLHRLYARNFPAYFGTGALPRLQFLQEGRWINLWARTDPIGWWVVSGDSDVDLRLLDVTSLTRGVDGPYPPICGHSGFWTRPELVDATTTLEAMLVPPGAEPAAAPPPADTVL